jgi:putative nucleotidyltransferase with HDIG domain
MKNKRQNKSTKNKNRKNLVDNSGLFFDSEKHNKEKEKIERLNRILRSLREINKLISKEKNITKLIQKSCENFIKTRGYECAWIVLFDRGGEVKYSAEAGVENNRDSISERLKGANESGSFKEILKTSEVHICDIKKILRTEKKDTSSSRCSGKIMITRLHYGKTLFGIIAISIPFEITHDKEEKALFKEIAEDIAFALHSIEEERERKEFEKALRYKGQFERLILDISSSFINLSSDEIKRGIEKALAEIGSFAEVDRSYLLQLSADKREIADQYVWYARGIEREVKIHRQELASSFPWASAKLTNFESIHIPDVKALPPEAKNEKEIMLYDGIKSFLLTPLISQGSLIGFLGFDTLRKEKVWSSEIIYLLKITGQIFADALERKLAEEKLRKSFQRMKKALEGTVQALSSIIEKKDPYTAGHQNRVARLSLAIGRELGLSEERLEALRFASLLHDIGKIQIPAEILNKPFSLNQIEMGLIKTHPQIGYEILKSIDFSGPVAEIVLQHHERVDGSGYPQGLSGSDILVEAQILGVADLIESMNSRRPYRAAFGIDLALEEIEGFRNVLYDSKVVDACVKLFREEEFSL